MLLAMLALVGVALLVAFGLGRGGLGVAHILGSLVLAVVAGAAAMLRGRPRRSCPRRSRPLPTPRDPAPPARRERTPR